MPLNALRTAQDRPRALAGVTFAPVEPEEPHPLAAALAAILDGEPSRGARHSNVAVSVAVDENDPSLVRLDPRIDHAVPDLLPDRIGLLAMDRQQAAFPSGNGDLAARVAPMPNPVRSLSCWHRCNRAQRRSREPVHGRVPGVGVRGLIEDADEVAMRGSGKDCVARHEKGRLEAACRWRGSIP